MIPPRPHLQLAIRVQEVAPARPDEHVHPAARQPPAHHVQQPCGRGSAREGSACSDAGRAHFSRAAAVWHRGGRLLGGGELGGGWRRAGHLPSSARHRAVCIHMRQATPSPAPWLGVMPPSARLPHSSTLSAPPSSAASALSRLSTQTCGGPGAGTAAFGAVLRTQQTAAPRPCGRGALFAASVKGGGPTSSQNPPRSRAAPLLPMQPSATLGRSVAGLDLGGSALRECVRSALGQMPAAPLL